MGLPAGEQLLREVAALPAADVLQRLATRANGLTAAEVADRRRQYGANLIATERPVRWPTHLWRAANSPFNYILVGIAALSRVTGDTQVGAVIAVLLAISIILPFTQELRSGNAAQALRTMVRIHATVLRDDAGALAAPSRGVELPIDQLVPGDIVLLAGGDMIPADVRLIHATDLFVAESALTGESTPVEKLADPGSSAATGLLPVTELSTLAFMGTSVVSGAATAVVVTTGLHTRFGMIAHNLIGSAPPTAFDLGVRRVSWLLIRFMAVMVPVVFVINGLTKGHWVAAFLFGLAVAVSLAPEMLPMMVTANLARGAVRMARQKTIVRRLNAIQNLGAMDVLCTDKTGTLTQDRVVLERYLDARGREAPQVLELAYLVSANQTGLKNLLDDAILSYAERFSALHGDEGYHKVDELPFDFTRRRMSVVLQRSGESPLLICKGAVEEIIATCTAAADGTTETPLTAATRQAALDLAQAQNAQGMRIVAVASKRCAQAAGHFTAADEAGLVLGGFVCFLDPPKESAGPALRALRDRGIAIKILTGDNEAVTRKICHDVDLAIGGVLMGHELDAVDDPALARRAAQASVFAKMTPEQKVRVVRSIRSQGHVVGYLGDGINDAGALREADVGISVDSAVDIARASADIILLEKDLNILATGVTEGRKIFANIMKYLKMTASSNFGNSLSVLIASALLPFLPMLPVQLLAQNLLYDVSQVAIPWDNVDPDYLMVPREWNTDDVGRFVLRIGPLSSLFDLLTFAVLWYLFKANSVARQGFFQSGWFVVGLLTQTLIVHMIRTRHIAFLQSRAAAPLIISTGVVMLTALLLPASWVGQRLQLVPLPATFFAFVALCAIAYAGTIELAKRLYIRRFEEWL
jgi:P-type Mg2+ transporter